MGQALRIQRKNPQAVKPEGLWWQSKRPVGRSLQSIEHRVEFLLPKQLVSSRGVDVTFKVAVICLGSEELPLLTRASQ